MTDLDANLDREPDLFGEAKRGQGADRLLNDEAFKAGMKGMNDATVDAIRACGIGDQEKLSYLHLMLRVVADFEKNLREVIETGHLAVVQLRSEEDTARFKREKAADIGIPVADLKDY